MGQNTVADLANWSPPQRLIKVGNRTVVEKLSPLLNRKVVDLDGNVCAQPASNGIANRSPQDPYGQQTHHEKMLGRPRMIKGTPGGVLPYSRCPQGIGGVRKFLDEYEIPSRAPCERSVDGKDISNSSPCTCIAELIAKRQAAARARNEENENRVNKLIRLQEQTAAANLDATKQLAAAAQSLAQVATAQSGKKDGK